MSTASTPLRTLPTCATIAAARDRYSPSAVLVSTMSPMHALDLLDITRRRLDSVPLMGGAAGLALGLALARPDLPVIVIDGDASLLMELGSLVTVAANKPRRFLHFLNQNGVQFNANVNLPTPSDQANCDFAAMARGAGYQHTAVFDTQEALEAALPDLMQRDGATFVALQVVPEPPGANADRPQPLLPPYQFVRMAERMAELRAELAR